MTTDQNFAHLPRTRIVSKEDLKDNLLIYLQTLQVETVAGMYNSDGVFDDKLGITSFVADEFDITGTNKSTDGAGHFLDHTKSAASFVDVVFGNSSAVDYDVGLQYCEAPEGRVVNARTGIPSFKSWREEIGVSAEPDSVTNLGSNLRMVINGHTEANEDNSGRTCLIYKVAAERDATTEAILIETVTSTYDSGSGENRVETVALFGQTGSPSTNPSDYIVVVLGPTVRRGTDLKVEPGVFYIGTITGNGGIPVAFNTDDQNVIDVTLSNVNAVISGFISSSSVNENDLAGKRSTTGPAFITAEGAAESFRDEEIFFMGGRVNSALTPSIPDNYSYNPSVDAWTAKAPIPLNGSIPSIDDRQNFTLTNVGDVMYLIGGVDLDTSADAAVTVQRYNAATNTWLSNGVDSPTPLCRHAAAAIGDKIYVFGGQDEYDVGSPTDDAYVYDTTLDSWSTLTIMNNSRMDMNAYVANGEVYVVGGSITATASDYTDKVEAYDPGGNSWAIKSPLPKVHVSGTFSNVFGFKSRYAGGVVNDVIHIIGGHEDDPPDELKFRADHYLYNPALDHWSSLRSPLVPNIDGEYDPPANFEHEYPAAPRHSAASATVEGVIYMFGGWSLSNTPGQPDLVQEVLGFDANQIQIAQSDGAAVTTGLTVRPLDSGSFVEPIPEIHNRAQGGGINNVIYLLGGITALSGGTPLGRMYKYYVETDTWMRGPDMPAAIGQGASYVDEYNERVYYTGGQDVGGTEQSDVLLYRVRQNTWETLTTGLTARRDHGAAGWGSKIHIIAGINGAGANINEHQVYDATLGLTTTLAAHPGAGFSLPAAVCVPKLDSMGAHSPQTNSGYRLLVFGGIRGTPVDENYEYDPVTNVWTQRLPLPFTIHNHSAVYIPPQPRSEDATPGHEAGDFAHRVVYFGGNAASTDKKIFWFDVVDSEIVRSETLSTPTDQAWQKLCLSKGRIFIMGGYNVGGATAVDENYRYDRFSWRQRLRIRNYTTGFRNDVIGFKQNQLWGIGAWAMGAKQDIVRIGGANS